MQLRAAWTIAVLVTLFAAEPVSVGTSNAQSPPSPKSDAATFDADKGRVLDALFAALHRSAGDAEADAVVAQIWATWSGSGKSDIDLMMAKASGAMQSRNYGLAVLLLDEVVDEAPLFAEGWNRRATLRFTMGDHAGALADVDKVLALEPRHFGALAGRGMIHMAAEKWEQALEAWRAALKANPFLKERHGVIPELQRRVEKGRL